MREHLLKRILPFVLALALGSALGVIMSQSRRCALYFTTTHPLLRQLLQSGCACPRELRPVRALVVQRELPEVRVLSPMLMEEVHMFELSGGGYESPRVISLPGPHFAPPPRRDYRQGVLQLSFYFGADGRVSEIEPPAKPHDCGDCLRGKNIVQIDPRDPASREYVEAAEEAVRQIKFVPGTLGGQPVGMHGLAECIFRLD